MAAADTVYPRMNTQTRLASDTADNIAWDRYSRLATQSPNITSALSRITFTTTSSATPLQTIVELVNTEAASSRKTLIVLAGRSRRMAVESHEAELRKLIADAGSSIGSTVPRTLGDVGAALVAKQVHASLLVLQAAVNPDSL